MDFNRCDEWQKKYFVPNAFYLLLSAFVWYLSKNLMLLCNLITLPVLP